jgi:hypothetical protein
MFLVVARGPDGDRHAHRAVARGIRGAGSSRYDLLDARDALVLDPAFRVDRPAPVSDGADAGGPRGRLASCEPEPVRHAITHFHKFSSAQDRADRPK